MRFSVLPLLLCFVFIKAAAQNQELQTFASTGDQTISLGRFQIGGSIEVLFRAEGNYSEIGGTYHIVANWGQPPVVAYRAESNLTRLKFYSYVDPVGGGFMFLFATWENQSPGKTSLNTLHFKTTSFGSIEKGPLGSFANASLINSLIASDLLINAVGVATTQPEALFHVNGDSKYKGRGWFSSKNEGTLAVALGLGQHMNFDYPVVEIRTSDNGGTSYSHWAASRWAHHFMLSRQSQAGEKRIVDIGGDDGYHYFSLTGVNGTTEVARLSSSGHSFIKGSVGIGTDKTTDADFRLFVDKGIRTRKVKVDNASWPDYVFLPGYSLLPLKEVEQFIQKNGHLPGVPSASEIEKTGVDLGENQATLLKKIEELTLYILKQQEEIDELKKIVSKK